ncbi:ABC transporter ATP-binding protein [Oceanibacterium hippocampi]|uniref:Spermidine/putrescine import ATP-binding protein PotA n=1 Tax=Oceanibacterium hippocampi TaxID=745714 RepID=A0A1Y5TIS2_9PROT|nr:ABC transporter ATP-binding protein [Oceanibacterium hippocampi]SLN65306.1 Spermidine/putrescine import ATP-binding protein PotA [Oceanibacterium hippocampi]
MNASSLPIRLNDISKHYGSVAALSSVSLDIEAGEFVTLLGPSGSGKTTLLNIIAGFIRLDSGAVHFGDTDVSFLPPHKRDLGMVFQNYALFPHMSVAGNVGFPLRPRKYAKADIARRVERALELVRLGGYGERRVSELSGGQRQRVALARAVVFEPKIILMDEPLSALDKQLREEMQIELRHLHSTLGATTVYVTHDQREALTMSDRIAILSDGKLDQVDTPQELYDAPKSRFVAEFVGESTLIPVSRIDDRRVRFGVSELRTERALPSGEQLLLAIRSEKLRFSGEAGDDVNSLPGSVEEIIYQGDSILVFLTLEGGGRISMRRPARHDSNVAIPAVGERIGLGLHPSHTVVVPAD